MSFESILRGRTPRLEIRYLNERVAVRILAIGLCALLLFGTASMPLGSIIPQASAMGSLPLALVDNHELINTSVSPQTLAESPSLPFILNEGQVHSDVRFYVDTFAGRVYVTDHGITYSLKSPDSNFGMAIKENFVQSNPLQAYGTDQNKAVVNYYAGEQSNWRSGIATFDKVSFGEVWNGINVELNAAGNNVEKIFTVAPGANVKDIQVAAEGVNSLSMNYHGQLVFATQLGEVTLTKPVAFQEIDGQLKSVEVSYIVGQDNHYGFAVGSDYDPNFALTIDPLLASTFLGGTENEGVSPNTLNPSKGAEIAFDSGGNVYIASLTLSDNYPATTTFLPDPNFNSDVVVSKLNSDLTSLLASTYISGNSLDEAVDIAIDSSGDVYITGRTNSTDYPTTDAYDQNYNGGGAHGNHDAFVTKLDSSLVIDESSYLGGNDEDEGYAIVMNSAGDVYVAGRTFSEDYPTTPGAYDTTFNAPGQAQGFITALDGDLSGLITSTLLGGNNDSQVIRLAINATDQVFAAGLTLATNFPIVGGFDSSKSGTNQHDTFIAIFDSALTTLGRSTFLGDGSVSGHHTTPFGLALSSDGKVYVAGLTRSPNFPTTPGAIDTTPNTTFRSDAYISVLPNSLDSLLASTVIGSDATNEGARGLALTSSAVYIVALAGTAITSWPTTPGAFNEVGNESYIAKLNLGLTTVLASTSIGGGNTDILEAIEIDTAGNVVVAGHTRSSNYPTTSGAHQTAKAGVAGTWDFVISKLTPDLAAASATPGISLDKDFYNANDLLNIQVVDAASNIDTDSADQIDVEITSYNPDDTPLSSYTLTLLETGAATGVFVFNDFILQDVGPLSGEAIETEANGEIVATFGSLSVTAPIAPALRVTILECYQDGDLTDPCLDTDSPRWGLDLVLVESTVYPELAGPGDEFDYTYLVDFGCDAPHQTVPDVSECSSWLTSTASDSEQATVSLFYPASDVGSRAITGRLYEGLNPVVGTLRATEPLATVEVQPHATELVLDPVRDVTATTGFTVSGRLMDIETVPPSEIAGQMITFDGSGATGSLQSVLTEGVTFGSNDPIVLEACPVPASCDLDSIGGIDPAATNNNVVRLGAGDTITFPASTVQVSLFVQDTGTDTFKYIVEEGDGSFQPEAESAGADPDVAIVQIISGYSPVGGDVVPNGIKKITITEVGGAPGNTVGIAAVLTLNPDGLPTQQHAINFEEMTAGPQDAIFTINPGHYYSTGFAQSTDVDGLEVTAEYAGSPQYEADQSDTETYNVLANTAGLGGEGSQSATGSSGGSVTVLSCGANSDNDNDAICDNWESSGITFGTATYQITADGGAQPGLRDIFVEIDCMTGFCPLASDLTAVEAAFAAEGYTLHLVLDETNLVVRSPLHVWTDTDADLNNDYDNIKKNHFGTAQERTAAGGTLGQGKDLLEAKAQVFRYILFAQNINTLENTACGPSGQAELGGNDAIVSVGCTVGTNKFLNSPQERQGTLMHELGHMLGLRHGGGDDDNCKPNLISVMSYTRQMPWSYLTATTAAGSPTQWKVTFSRQDLASLNENAQLSESGGLAITSAQWSGITSFKIIWGKPGATPSVLTGSTGPNINWNNAGAATESGVSQNINKLGSVIGCNTGTTLSTLQSYDEWTLIDASDLNFRDGGNIDGFVYPDADTVAELTAEGLTQLNAFGDQFQGVEQPINDVTVGDPGISVFNQKSTIPIKFTLLDALGEPVTPADVTHIKLKIAPISTGLPPDGDYTEPISSNPASPGDQFTYNAELQMWEFHLGTKNMAANKQYSIKIIVDLGLPTETLLDHNGDGVTAVFALK